VIKILHLSIEMNRFKLLNILTPEEQIRKKREQEELEKVRLQREEKKKIKTLRLLEAELLKYDAIAQKTKRVDNILAFEYFPRPRKVKPELPFEQPSTTDVFTYDYKSFVPKIKIAGLAPATSSLTSLLDFPYVDETIKPSENTCAYYIQAIKHLVKYINVLITRINDLIHKNTDWMLAYPENTFNMVFSIVKESDWLLDLKPPSFTEKTQHDILNANYHTNIYPHTIRQPDRQTHDVNRCLFYDKYNEYKRDVDIVPLEQGAPASINKIWGFDYSDSEDFNMGLYMYIQQYQCLFAYYTEIQDRLAHLVLMKELGLLYYKMTLELLDSPDKSLEDVHLRNGVIVRAESILEGIRVCLSHMPNIPKNKREQLRLKVI